MITFRNDVMEPQSQALPLETEQSLKLKRDLECTNSKVKSLEQANDDLTRKLKSLQENHENSLRQLKEAQGLSLSPLFRVSVTLTSFLRCFFLFFVPSARQR